MEEFVEDGRDRMKRAMNEIRQVCKDGEVTCTVGSCPMYWYCGDPKIEPWMWDKELV